MKDRKSVLLVISAFLFAINLSCNGRDSGHGEKKYTITEPMYGVTVDDGWSGEEKLHQIVDAIKAMSVKPTVRIVMSENIRAEDYVHEFEEIHKVAYVMAQPVDSYYMERYKSVEDYRKRFEDSYHYLSPYVDMWEIANEINGEGWIGDDRQFNADKMYAAYEFIRDKGSKTVLVSYEVAPGKQEVSMVDWLKEYVPEDMKKDLDYLMVSYYEDDNDNYQPDWDIVFNELKKLFPSSKLAIGECGNTAKDATVESKMIMAKKYYTMSVSEENFIGGYFWWNWVQDCVSHQGNPIWETINESVTDKSID